MTRSRNSPGSVNEIDFPTALARLLRDTALREQFAREPAVVAARLQVRADEREPFAAMSVEEIEIQATILLRKRFDAVRRLIPVTMERLGDQASECFLVHARGYWPEATAMEINDTEIFCTHLAATEPAALCPAEMNRLRFHLNRQPVAVHFVREFRLRGRTRRALQVLIRRGRGWSEHALYFAAG